jgi:hypothetical protein
MAANGECLIVRFVPANSEAILCLSVVCVVLFCHNWFPFRGAIPLKSDKGKDYETAWFCSSFLCANVVN